jgi:uncharacterized membrane protein YqiK
MQDTRSVAGIVEKKALQKKALALIENLPSIIRESVKPMEQIDGIKIFQLDGLNANGGGNNGGGHEASAGGNLADQVVNSALRYRGQAPLVDMLMSEIGLEAGDINGLTRIIQQEKPAARHAVKDKKTNSSSPNTEDKPT